MWCTSMWTESYVMSHEIIDPFFVKNMCDYKNKQITSLKIKIYVQTLLKKQKLVRENVKSLSNSVTKFCDQGICEEFHFFRH